MYEIQEVGSPRFIILLNDRPMVDPQGQVLLFYRRIDVERWIDEMKMK